MSKAPDFDPIINFLQKSDYLLRNLPAERRSRALTEAEAHLRERANELIDSGMSADKANAEAVVSFGDVQRWAQEMTQSAYATRFTPAARWLTLVSAALLMPMFVGLLMIDANENIWWIAPVAVALPFMGLIAGSVMWKQYHPLLLLAVLCFATAASFSVAGVYAERNWNVMTQSVNADMRNIHQDFNRNVALLEIGNRIYRTEGRDNAVPAELRFDTRYIVPTSYDSRARNPFRSQMVSFYPVEGGVANVKHVVTLIDTVSSPTEAATIWEKQAPLWLSHAPAQAARIAEVTRDEAKIQNAGFSEVGDALWSMKNAHGWLYLLIALVAHLASTTVGRWYWLLRSWQAGQYAP